jgi:hypothetical protein
MAEDTRRRVASALKIPQQLVSLAGLQVNPSGLILQSSGTADGARFVAKTFLVNPYPIHPRFATPREELAGQDDAYRSVEEQIIAEWTWAQRMCALMGTQAIPLPMGHSIENRTLVFEEVNAVRMDRIVNSRWPGHGKMISAEAAMFQAGAWLRRLHESSSQGYETMDLGEVAADLNSLVRKRAIETAPFAGLARWALESAGQEFNRGTSLCVPVAFSHGDFTLPNLLWSHDRQHLWVVDFELSARRPILHDLCTMIFDLRKRLLHPLTSPRVIQQCEKSFWRGYGAVSKELPALANALATARIFYSSLPRISTLRERRGFTVGLKASLYKVLFQPFMLERLRTR